MTLTAAPTAREVGKACSLPPEPSKPMTLESSSMREKSPSLVGLQSSLYLDGAFFKTAPLGRMAPSSSALAVEPSSAAVATDFCVLVTSTCSQSAIFGHVHHWSSGA